MGAWGSGSFENDAALDWAGEVRSLDDVRAPFERLGEVGSGFVDADLAFHNAIYKASGNSLIAQSAQLHWGHLRRVMGAVHRAYGPRSTIWDEHQAIAEAIGQGDAERAVLLTDLHTRRARKNVLERLGEVLTHRGELVR